MRNIYLQLPYYQQFIIVNGYALKMRHARFNGKFHSIFSEYMAKDRSEEPDLNLKKIIALTRNSRFYSIKNENDFYNSPVICKEIAKENYNRIINVKEVSSYLFTSGTTGSGFKYPVSSDFLNHQNAIFWKFRTIHGLNFNSWCGYIIGKNLLNTDRKKPPFWIKAHPTHQVIFSSAHLNLKTVEAYLQKLKSENIRWLHAYPSMLNYLTDLIKERNLEELAADLKLSIITTSSETLFKYQQYKAENLFGCKIRQLYGQTEGVANFFECENGSFHIDESFSYVEFLPVDDFPGHYKIIGTAYNNTAFPLIRYDTGDMVKITGNEKCACGRISRVVSEISGRSQDFIILDDGTKVCVPGYFFHKITNVKTAQVYQSRKGEAVFYVVKAESYNIDDEILLKNEIRDRLGRNFRYKIEYTDRLKYRSATERSGS